MRRLALNPRAMKQFIMKQFVVKEPTLKKVLEIILISFLSVGFNYGASYLSISILGRRDLNIEDVVTIAVTAGVTNFCLVFIIMIFLIQHQNAHRVIAELKDQGVSVKVSMLTKTNLPVALDNFESAQVPIGLPLELLNWYDQSRAPMKPSTIYNIIAQFFNGKYAVYDGAWSRVSTFRMNNLLLIVYSILSLSSLLVVTSVQVPEEKSEKDRLIAFVVQQCLEMFSLVVLAIIALLVFTGVSSLGDIRRVGEKVKELPLDEAKKLSFLAANAFCQVRGIDATNACYTSKAVSGETKGFVPVPAWAVFRAIKVSGEGLIRKETDDGEIPPPGCRNFFLWGSERNEQSKIQRYCSRLAQSPQASPLTPGGNNISPYY